MKLNSREESNNGRKWDRTLWNLDTGAEAGWHLDKTLSGQNEVDASMRVWKARLQKSTETDGTEAD